MKQISQEQIQAILDELIRLNVPVQSYNATRNLLISLPDITEIKNDKEK
jgi:hypothetical protein